MKRALIILSFLTASCAPIKRVQAALAPPTPKDVQQIVLSALDPTIGHHCYTTKFGTNFSSDGTIACPPQSEVELVQESIGKTHRFTQKDLRWEKLSVMYTKEVIDCGSVPAMGCTLRLGDDQAVSVVSLYFPWRRAILRHELTHVAYYWNKEPEMRHFCLDNPDLCETGGLKFIGE